MADDTSDRRSEDGFELDGTFYRWALSDQGKDLMLIDRFTQMPISEFFSVIEDGFDRGRGPVLLAMIATSIRAGNPDWTVERVVRRVMDLSLGDDVTFIDGGAEEDPRPPAIAAEAPPLETSNGTSDVSSSSSIPPVSSSSRTSYVGPV